MNKYIYIYMYTWNLSKVFICEFFVSEKCNYIGGVGDDCWSEGGESWGYAGEMYGRGRAVGEDGMREEGGGGRGYGCMGEAWAVDCWRELREEMVSDK